jgi:hypothetical protein
MTIEDDCPRYLGDLGPRLDEFVSREVGALQNSFVVRVAGLNAILNRARLDLLLLVHACF